jgi:hypothetical protein
VKVQQPSLWTLGLGALDLGRQNVSDVKRSFRDYHPVPFKVVAGGALLTLGLGLVAMDLVRHQPLRAWWVGELARRGEEVESQIWGADSLRQGQAPRKERDHDLAR